MPQESWHPQYRSYLPQWTRCRQAIAGSDAIKAAGEVYLPKPSGMSVSDYVGYKLRAGWFGAAARTHQGILGLIFREAPDILAPPSLLPALEDVTGTGMSLATLSAHVVGEHLTTGRIGLLEDLPAAAIPANAVHPRWRLYTSEEIINWWLIRTPTGETVYSRVVLEEAVDGPDPQHPSDSYAHGTQLHWRELVLEQGRYVVRVWEKTSTPAGVDFHLIEEYMPLRRGQPLDFLPFHIQNADTSDAGVTSPPLLDVVDLNLEHYRTNADYKHSLHMTALETPWVTGWDARDSPLTIGASVAWVFPDPATRVGMVGVSGNGLAAMLESLRQTEGAMQVLGARLLEPQQRSIESAETHSIRQSAELSIMETYANAASTLLTTMLRLHGWWAGITERLDDPALRVTLNTTFLPRTIDAPTLTALVSAYEAGVLTQQDLYYNLSHSGLLEPGIAFEDWLAKLASERVTRPAL